MAGTTYYAWVTLGSDAYTEAIVGKLIRQNWQVKALGRTLSLHNQDNLSVLMAFSLSKEPKDDKAENAIDLSKVLEEIKDVLKRLKVHYHSLIVSESTGCTWCMGNITQSQLRKIEEERKKTMN